MRDPTKDIRVNEVNLGYKEYMDLLHKIPKSEEERGFKLKSNFLLPPPQPEMPRKLNKYEKAAQKQKERERRFHEYEDVPPFTLLTGITPEKLKGELYTEQELKRGMRAEYVRDFLRPFTVENMNLVVLCAMFCLVMTAIGGLLLLHMIHRL